MKRVIPLRAYLVARTALTVAASYWAPSEPVYALRASGGAFAEATIIASLALAVLALLDLFLSETASRWWTLVRLHRWAIWVGLGAGHAMQAVIAFDYGYTPWVACDFGLVAIGCFSVAVMDVRYRYCDRNEKLVASGLAPLDGPLERKWRE